MVYLDERYVLNIGSRDYIRSIGDFEGRKVRMKYKKIMKKYLKFFMNDFCLGVVRKDDCIKLRRDFYVIIVFLFVVIS